MGLFGQKGLSRAEAKKLAQEADCSTRVLNKRFRVASENGMSKELFVDHEMFRLTAKELERYMTRPSPRRFVDVMVKRDGAKAYDAYSQLKRAREEFGISHSIFTAGNYLNASDEALKRRGEKSKRKKALIAKRISKALDISNEEADGIITHISKKFGYSPMQIFYNQLFLMNDEELAEYREKGRERVREMHQRVMDKTGWTIDEVRAHISHCQSDFGVDLEVYYPCRCYLLSDEQLASLGTMSDSRKISARFNKKGSIRLLNDKKLFNETYKKHVKRKFWVNRDTSFEEFSQFIDGLDALFCKPLNLSMGVGTSRIGLEGRDLHELYDELLSEPKLLVEENLSQHGEMGKFYPDTLNTVRLFSILDNGKFDAFAAFVRFGVQGVTDNYSTGGIGCGVDPATGVIVTPGSNKEGEIFETHPVTGEKFEGFQIPHWDQVLKEAEEALREVPGINYVGWDFAIREDDVAFVEGNATPDLGVQQALFAVKDELIKPQYAKYL